MAEAILDQAYEGLRPILDKVSKGESLESFDAISQHLQIRFHREHTWPSVKARLEALIAARGKEHFCLYELKSFLKPEHFTMYAKAADMDIYGQKALQTPWGELTLLFFDAVESPSIYIELNNVGQEGVEVYNEMTFEQYQHAMVNGLTELEPDEEPVLDNETMEGGQGVIEAAAIEEYNKRANIPGAVNALEVMFEIAKALGFNFEE